MPSSFRLFNTMSARKERFKPIRHGKVSMFVCGPTVQSPIHLGHARTYVFYDVLARYLVHHGFQVNYLMNITDFDERITQAASSAKEDPGSFAHRYADAFLQDMAALKCSTVSRFEPVSGHVETMIRQVETLVDSGRAYAADGWVYFDTSRFRRFGRLSHMSKSELALRPLELSPRKRHLPDFALWRPEILLDGKWESPWGIGSPGWHIQDTAVTLSILGAQYDIHGGAYELVYPHHEAEIAQNESLTGLRPAVRYWVHTHHVNMRGRKMSKSLGNVVTVRDALRSYTADELRVHLLGVHYRRDMDLSGLEASAGRVEKMKRIAKDTIRSSELGTSDVSPAFEEAMNDDLDTPRAIDSVERALRAAGRQRDSSERSEAVSSSVAAMRILGVDLLGAS